MTNQEVFDRVVAHLRKQGRPALYVSEGDYVGCAYRNQEGLKCAIGALIPDDLYRPSFEGVHVEALLDAANEAKIAELFRGVNPTLLSALQKCHDERSNRLSDGSFSLPKLEANLQAVAGRFGLNYPTVL